MLVTDAEHRRNVAKSSYETVEKLWRAEVAAQRFVSLCNAIFEGKDITALYENGPISPAGIIKNDWIKSI